MNWFEKNTNFNMPPKSADRFLGWFCSERYIEEVLGDLHELYRTRFKRYGWLKRYFFYYLNVLKFFRPYLLRKNIFRINFMGGVMFKSYLKISVRNLYKNSFYSGVNIIGLAVGMACVLFIVFFIKDELSYDRFNEKSDQICRVTLDAVFKGKEFKTPNVGGPVGEGIKNEFPEVLDYVRLNDAGISFVRHEETTYKEPHIHYADSTFFNIFSIPILMGDPGKILNAPYQIAISRNIAGKYFGRENPVGKVLKLDERQDYTISGVFENFPQNSHFHADFIASLSSDKNAENDNWTNVNYYTYLLLRKGTKAGNLESKFTVLTEKYVKPEVESFGMSLDEFLKTGNKWDFKLQPLTDIHLYSELAGDLEANSSIQYVYIFGTIGFFILLLASINFINLSTAKSSTRAKEVGIKKVVGSYKKDLVFQFLTETVTISIISLILAVGLVELLLPAFNSLADKQIVTSYFSDFTILGTMMGIAILTGVLAGSFPAFVFSSFNPISVLKGDLSAGLRRGWLRSTLVIFQFTISIILIIGSMIVYNQLNYIQNRNLGFERDHRLIIDDAYILGTNTNNFKKEVKDIAGVINATVTGYLPIDSYRSTNGTFPDGMVSSPSLIPMETWRIDCDYVETMGLEIIKGRNFSPDILTDSNAVIVNEACVKHFEWSNPLDHAISKYVNMNPIRVNNWNVIGVVKDFHFASLKDKIQPLVFHLRANNGYITIRFNTSKVDDLIDNIKVSWEKFAPGQPFGFRFMDESFDKMYTAEKRIGKIFSVFAFIAVFIGCLGLFALSAFTAERKTKEIGVRMVLGATTNGMVVLLSREFIKLVLIAFLIASPMAYYLMSNWLNDYAYRVDINFGTILLAGGLSILIAVLTVSYHAIKAAHTNPARSLKYE